MKVTGISRVARSPGPRRRPRHRGRRRAWSRRAAALPARTHHRLRPRAALILAVAAGSIGVIQFRFPGLLAALGPDCYGAVQFAGQAEARTAIHTDHLPPGAPLGSVGTRLAIAERDTLLGMASPEQVSRRVDRAEQDLTAISHTVLDIKETVDGHTETLAEHGRKLDAITGRLDVLEGRMEEGFAVLESRMEEGFVEILRVQPGGGRRR
ncbi:MAG: hypothetical protein ACRDT0_11210 [Pseudonocardiaceae bacterium]